MTARPQLRVLFFDVFDTCVGQQTQVADELFGAAQGALQSATTSINSDVRENATKMVCFNPSTVVRNLRLILV